MDNLQRVLNTYSPTLGLSNVHVKYISEQDAISDEAIQRINRHPWSVIEYRSSIPPQALQLDRCAYCGSIAESVSLPGMRSAETMTATLLNQTPLERNCQKAIDTFGYLVIGADRRRYELGNVVFLDEYHSPDVRCLVKIVGDSTEAEFIRQFVQVFGVEKDFEYDGPPEDVRFYRAIAE